MCRRGGPLFKGVFSTWGERYASLRRVVNIAALAMLVACASVPTEDQDRMAPPGEAAEHIDFSREPPADWPKLAIEVREVPYELVLAACARTVAQLGIDRIVWGCSVIRFCPRRCTISVPEGLPAQDRNEIVLHEKAHCLGYEHYGSTVAREAWERAKARGCGP